MQKLIEIRENHTWISEVPYVRFVKYYDEFQRLNIMSLPTNRGEIGSNCER